MASNSDDSHEYHGSLSTTNKLRVLILGSEWGSSKGGLSTINREFAINLAKHSGVHVTFFVPQCNDRDKSAANSNNIDLREAEQFDGMDELQWLCFPPHDLPIDIVIGHGAKLGPQANAIKRTRGNCKWVQFVHTAPEELGIHKEYPNRISSGEEKHNTEVKLCEKADFVVTVGPKLHKAFRSYLSSCKTDQNVFCFTPGLFSEFSEVVQVPERSGNFQVLLVGRGDAEDFSLKGFDIAADAIALLTNTDLYFVGALEGEHEATAERFLARGIHADALHVKSFLNRECLKKMFYQVDLVILPSRTEGFGLTGLEALSAGLPILVSQNTGFGQTLREVPLGSYSLVKSNEASVWSDAIKDVMEKNREIRLKESAALRAFYGDVYSWEKQIGELVEKMMKMVRGPCLENHTAQQTITFPQNPVPAIDQQATVAIEFKLKEVTYKDGISGHSESVMKEMARRFLKKRGDGIPLEQWPKELSYYIDIMLDLNEINASEGSLRISVECRTLPILERLWEDYRCGHLNEVAEKRLLTDDIKEKFSVESVKLETIILEEDYLACKLFLMDTSNGGFPNMKLPEKVLETKSADTSLNEFPEYPKSLRLVQNSRQQEADEPTVRIAVECHNLEILECLWHDFCSGHLNVVAEKMLLTDDIKERFHVESISLQATILEEDYLACKKFLLAKANSSSQCENETRAQADKETQVQSADETRTKAIEEPQLHLGEESCTLFPVPSTEQTRIMAAEETQIHSAGETWVQDVEETKGEYDKARESCTAVLKQDPENREGGNILERVDRIKKEKNDETKGKRRKNKKKTSGCHASEEPVVPDKTPESEEISKDILAKIEKDREKLQQQNKKCDEMEEGPRPFFDVKAEYTKISSNENEDVPQKKSRGSQRRNLLSPSVNTPCQGLLQRAVSHKETGLSSSDHAEAARQSTPESRFDAAASTSAWESLEKISGFKMFESLNLDRIRESSILSAKSQMGSNPGITTEVSNHGSNVSQETQELLPKTVVRLCQHFVKDRKTPVCCFSCSKHSKFEYGIWRNTKRKWQLIRPYPRDVNAFTPFRICWHYSNGSECVPGCKFAHGEEELNLWSTRRQEDHNSSREYANLQVHHFDLNRQPQQRIQGSLIIHDTRETRPRSPPLGVYNGNYQLCKWWKAGRVCRTGRLCTFAHGQQELQSWIELAKTDPPATNIEGATAEKSSGETTEKAADTLQSEMVYSLPGVQVSTDKPPVVQISLRDDETRHTYQWKITITFEIGEVGMLKQIDLTHGYHDCYQLTRIRGFLNDKEIFSEKPRRWRTYSLPTWIEHDAKSGQMKVDVSISFETPASSSNRTFTQCVRFDFGKKPFLLLGLNVDVASKEGLGAISAMREAVKLDASVWTKGSVEVVAWPESAAVSNRNGALQDRFQPPSRIENVVSAQVIDKNITAENYQRTMHQLLFTEELFMKKALSRFILCNVHLDCQQSISGERTGMVFAVNGELFGVLTLQTNETPQPDDAAGRLLFRNVQTAWLKLTASSYQKVYEALIEKVDNASIVLKLSSQMCSDLQLTNNARISVDVQFQLNRQPLCEWHSAIDRLGPTQRSLLFPEQSASQEFNKQPRPLRNYSDMDPSQMEVVSRILEPEAHSPSLVVFGPFGTGKTFTLHQAIRELVTRRNKRILLCTHTNSAADLHVQLLHKYLTEQNGLKAAKPLRIYHTWRRLDADSSVAKKYALIANNAYVLPTREDVIKHRVVITTLATSQHLLDLQLNHGFFTHILVDEAAQALEPEALTPLALAGPNTKVVFTGDHMQMKPEVYSPLARDWGLQRSLPERLFDYYHEKQTNFGQNVMFLTRNYRCHPDILQFPSDNFYGKGLIACSVEAAHPKFGPLLFFSTTGVEEAINNSYTNTAEAVEVVKRVKELCDDWPVEWGEKDLSKIGVISAYMTQVQTIRRLLRKERGELGSVTVESIYNVQGKEFRAVFISTVRTSLTCQDFNSSVETPYPTQQVYWEFLSDATLLNTAITRAKSLVAVIGDSVSLCTVGDCRGNWRDYIKRCNDRKALHGTSYEELNRKINASLHKISLNPLASNFVPNSQREANTLECESGEECVIEQDKRKKDSLGLNDPKDNDQESLTFLEAESGKNVMTNKRNECQTLKEKLMKEETSEESKTDEEEECESLIDSLGNENESESGYEEGDNNSEICDQEDINDAQETSTFFDEFRREIFEDEAVFPRYMDKIIAALVEKCQESKEPDAAYSSLQAAKVSKRKTFTAENHARLPGRQEKPSFSGNLSSTDYQIIHINGRTKTRLVNLDFQHNQSSRVQRLTTISRQDDYLDAEILQRYLLTAPEIYVPCTLRLSSESFRSVYGVVSDTKTPDIKIKDRVRGVFDMDRVVLEKTLSGPSTSRDDVPVPRGKILGVLSHIISPHERQYVCRVDYENPEVMLPINKSVSKIVTLSAKDVKGMPIYKELRDGDDDKLRVDVMDLAEFRSGKYLFLVQYLQWRSDCAYPLGIIIRKLPQMHTVNSSMEILFAEHGIRTSFQQECTQEVRTKFPVTWSVPEEEYRNREKIDGAFTVDPESSKDLDDAVTVEELPESVYRIGVHIADVSYFVEEGTSLDKEAFFRSTSYYPGHGYKGVPMLPPELSENHCSLLPGKDGLSLSVFLDLSKEGRLLGQPAFQRTIVRSCCRLSYKDAQKIINGQDPAGQQIPADTARKIQALSLLSQRRRVLRLGHAAFDHWSNSDHDPESFEAHEMVEEMMILVNEETAKFLCAKIPDLAPVRTQLPPKDHRLSDWVQQYGQFMPYSLFLRSFYSEESLRKMAKERKISGAKEFKVQRYIWSEICDAGVTENHSRLRFLICNDSHHPQLAVANSQFRAIQQKSQYICKEEQVGEHGVLHFSLGMPYYTHFTSPIRRYIDIQVHRLLLNLILTDRTAQESSKEKVAKVCRRSTFAQDNSRKFDKACTKVHIAANLRSNSHDATKAVVALIEDQAITLEFLSLDYKDLSRRQRRIKLSSLNPLKVDFNEDGSDIKFTWQQRIYLAHREGEARESSDEKEEVKRLLSQGEAEKGEVVDLPGRDWQQILKAVLEENYVQLRELLRETNRRMHPNSTPNTKRADENNMDYIYDKTLSLRRFDVVNIQLCANMTHGVLHPEIQLFRISPCVNICIEHRKYPRPCFATTSRSPASRKKYSSVESYIHAWEPVLAMEAATGAVDESDEFTIYNVEVQWTKKCKGDIEGSFHLHEDYCSKGQIDFFEGDFVCIRVREDHYLTDRNSGTIASSTVGSSTSEPNIARLALSSLETSSHHDTCNGWSSFWVGHCIIRHIKKLPESLDEPCRLEVKMDLHQSSSDFPEALLTTHGLCSTLNVIHRSLPHRRMLSALRLRLPSASHLIQAICMGHDPPQEEFGDPPSSNLSIVRRHPMSGLKPLNRYQEKAVKEALSKPFTLVQGPPGTGKTVTGVHMAYWFTKQNMMQSQPNYEDSTAPPQVLYCGPSNKSVDVVAIKMLKIPDIKILRVYGDRKEEAEFPIPNKRKPLKISADDEFEIKHDGLKTVSLHHVIRGEECPYASDLRDYDRKFEEDQKNGVRTEDLEVENYRTKIDEAKKWALTSSGVQIILCTCATAGSPRIIECCNNIQQCIVDECGMCLEPESLVPLTSSRARQVVMIGDHKQLQPVIQDQLAKTLGLNISMFERLSKRSVMLELQYRMHYGICQFPSQYFYKEKLQTDESVSKCDPRLQSFWPSQEGETLPIAFCHVEGEEETSAIKTSQSNEQSQANMKEVCKVVHVARHLILKRSVNPGCVVVLTPYREQRSRIQNELQKVYRCKDIDVKTIVKSQGSEWDYVIVSLVRSTKTDELDPDPSLSWLREHLGFLTDEHQINVGLTRARKGLCIIGNKNLLKHHPMWKKLLEFYQENHCLVDESNWPTN